MGQSSILDEVQLLNRLRAARDKTISLNSKIVTLHSFDTHFQAEQFVKLCQSLQLINSPQCIRLTNHKAFLQTNQIITLSQSEGNTLLQTKPNSLKELVQIILQILQAIKQYTNFLGGHGLLQAERIYYRKADSVIKVGLPFIKRKLDDLRALRIIVYQLIDNQPFDKFWKDGLTNQAFIKQSHNKLIRVYGEVMGQMVSRIDSQKLQLSYMEFSVFLSNKENFRSRTNSRQKMNRLFLTTKQTDTRLSSLSLKKKKIEPVIYDTALPTKEKLGLQHLTPATQQSQSQFICQSKQKQSITRPLRLTQSSNKSPLKSRRQQIIELYPDIQQIQKQSQRKLKQHWLQTQRQVSASLQLLKQNPLLIQLQQQQFSQDSISIQQNSYKPYNSVIKFNNKLGNAEEQIDFTQINYRHSLDQLAKKSSRSFGDRKPPIKYKSVYSKRSYPDGSSYQGWMDGDKRNGHGKFLFNGKCYDGQWQNDRMQGHGLLYYQNGQLAYDGEWQDDKMEGWGAYFNQNPDYSRKNKKKGVMPDSQHIIRYQGQFKSNRRHGQGRLYFTNGDWYEGEFIDNQLDGEGTYYQLGGSSRHFKFQRNKILKMQDNEY